MAASPVKVDGAKVSVEDSGRTVVNVNICQESSLAYLVKAVAAAGQKQPQQKAPAPKTPEPSSLPRPSGRAPCTGEQKVLGGVQILLGLTCLGFGGVLCLLNDYLQVIGSGAPFWMGSLFLVSGSLCVLSERRGGCCWLLLATFFNLASVVAVCVGLAFGVADLEYLRYMDYSIKEACQGEGGYRGGYGDYGGGYGSWRATRSPDNDWRLQACKDRMRNLLNIVSGVQILLLIFSVAALGIALFCFGYGLRTLCCSRQANSEENYVPVGDPEAPYAEVPPPYEEPAKENMAA
ncbi:UNVERIFIED_CONTAM: hypothetical protein K2H54_003625 [Gekko kuhli]